MWEHLERQTSLTNNQRKIVLAFIVGSWQLTYGQSAMILLSSGLGAVPGALFWG